MFRTVSQLGCDASKESECVYPAQYVPKLKQNFVVGEPLGAGGFGTIVKVRFWRCRDLFQTFVQVKRKSDDKDFALKIIKFDTGSSDVKKNRREADTLFDLHHKNVVRYYDSWMEIAKIPRAEYEKFQSDELLSSELEKWTRSGYISNAIDDDDETEDDENEDNESCIEDNVSCVGAEKHIRIVEGSEDSSIDFRKDEDIKEVKYLLIQMELCTNLTLRNAIDNGLYLDEAKLDKYFREICEGLAYIHQYNIVHRDLKPENIFLTKDDVIKIGDFGLSKKIAVNHEIASDEQLPFASLTDVCGTTFYIAPELSYKKSFNIKADIYSLGVTYFEMCSKPMVGHEKQLFLGKNRIHQNLKEISFPTNNKKKKVLIDTLLRVNVEERPTCEEILKILNSEKAINDIQEFIKQSRKVPFSQFKKFEKDLKASLENVELKTFFTKTAAEIFELHGGRNIPMPTFLPSFREHSDNLTNLLYTKANSTSVSDTSRCAFAYCVARNSIKNVRRYSVGNTFQNGSFSPTEQQECLFQIISSQKDDFVNDAEVMYIATELRKKILPSENCRLRFYINHGFIFSTVLEECKITGEEAAMFINMLLNENRFEGDGFIINKFAIDRFTNLRVHESKEFLLYMAQSFNWVTAKTNLIAMFKPKYHRVVAAFNQLENIVKNADMFGINSDDIFVAPLLIRQKRLTGFTFEIRDKYDIIFASGGRFENLIQQCKRYRKKRSINAPNFSAVDISFNAERVISVYQKFIKTIPSKIIPIISDDKIMAIPLYKTLLENKIKCEIVREMIVNDNTPLIIRVINVDECVVYRVLNPRIPASLQKIYAGKWTDGKLSFIIASLIAQLPQITNRTTNYLKIPIVTPMISLTDGLATMILCYDICQNSNERYNIKVQIFEMPQEFHALQCLNCEAFQVHIVKKVPKWVCKICGEKQSLQRIFAKGSSVECRGRVQALNTQRLTMPKVALKSGDYFDTAHSQATNSSIYTEFAEVEPDENEGLVHQGKIEPSVNQVKELNNKCTQHKDSIFEDKNDDMDSFLVL